MRAWVTAISICLGVACIATAGDLYHIKITNSYMVPLLEQAHLDPLARSGNDFFIMMSADDALSLQAQGIASDLIASGVDPQQLFLDRRSDDKNSSTYQTLFQQGRFRILRLSEADQGKVNQFDLLPLQVQNLHFQFNEFNHQHQDLVAVAHTLGLDLDELIANVSLDSVQSYVNRLQAFNGRVVGADSNLAARDWLRDKLVSFGYSTVSFDTFLTRVGSQMVASHNVFAFKTGSRCPNQKIIIGAHFDAVPGSPGADDNGSGVAAVLEMARIFAGIETDMSLEFVLFDGEEYGMYGSCNYAKKLVARGDSVVYMHNMDMIGSLANDSQAKVYCGNSSEFGNLWAVLADSLVGINATLYPYPDGATDDLYFSSYGYRTLDIMEFQFSSVYHSTHDSTPYMNFSYFTRMIKASLANIYTVSQTYAQAPGLAFEAPGGFPLHQTLGLSQQFDIVVSGVVGGQPIPGTGVLYHSENGGAYLAEPMTEISPNHYRASLPAAIQAYTCGGWCNYYFSAEESHSGTMYSGSPAAPYRAVSADSTQVILDEKFDTHEGWTVQSTATAGAWDYGYPSGDGAQSDPTHDFDGNGRCFVTGNATGINVDGGATELVSPTIDCPAADARIHFAFWFADYFGDPSHGFSSVDDTLKVYLSTNNGSIWVLAEAIPPSLERANEWTEHTLWLSDYVSPGTSIKLKFVAADRGGRSCVEAAIDDVTVTGIYCLPALHGLRIAGNDLRRVVNHQPEFAWTFQREAPDIQDSFALEVGRDTDWVVAELWKPPVVSGPDSVISYAGGPLDDGSTYYVRARIHATRGWTPWDVKSFYMDRKPFAPVALSPIGEAAQTTNPVLTLQNSTDPDGDTVRYRFQVYSDSLFTTLLTEGNNIAAGSGQTSWQVQVPLSDHRIYFWVASGFDGWEYSNPTPAKGFGVVVNPTAPLAAILHSPPANASGLIYTRYPQFTWEASADLDPYDEFKYTLEVSLVPGFQYTILKKDSLQSVAFTFTDSLKLKSHYWWRVTTHDKYGLTSAPAVKEFWTWTPGDVDHSKFVDLRDLSTLVSYLSGGGAVIDPITAGDTSGDCKVNLADLSQLVSYLTGGGAALKTGC